MGPQWNLILADNLRQGTLPCDFAAGLDCAGGVIGFAMEGRRDVEEHMFEVAGLIQAGQVLRVRGELVV